MAKLMKSAKSGDVVTARHEAAHAVVSVRLNLPLAYSHIRRRTVTEDNGDKWISVGYTTVIEGSSQAWVDALPDPIARERIEAMASQAAAGPAADAESGMPLGDVSHQDDLEGLVVIARVLGIGDSNAEAPVREWMADRCRTADALLSLTDDGAAWDRVRVTLARKRYLTGEEVKALVAQSDVSRGEQPWHCTADVAQTFLDQLRSGGNNGEA